jgi:hypothetical protein
LRRVGEGLGASAKTNEHIVRGCLGSRPKAFERKLLRDGLGTARRLKFAERIVSGANLQLTIAEPR